MTSHLHVWRSAILALLGSSLLAVSCRSTRSHSSPSASSAASSSTLSQNVPPKPGEVVVIEGGIATFWQGQVTEVTGPRVKYTYGPSHAHNQAPLAKVYRLTDNGTKFDMTTGDAAICRQGESNWVACEVRAAKKDKIIVLEKSGRERQLDPRDVLRPRGLTADNIERVMKENSKRIVFAAKAAAAGLPSKPTGWEPTPGDEVIAMRGTTWRSAKIRRVTPERIQVAWADGSPHSDLTYSQVAPMPQESQPVQPGQFILMRPLRGTEWTPALVLSIDGAVITIEDQTGRRRKTRDTDIVILGIATASADK